MFCLLHILSEIWFSCLSKEPHCFPLRYSRPPFHMRFALIFRLPFQHGAILSRTQNRDPKQQKKHRNQQKDDHPNEPVAKPCKKALSGGLKPLKLTTIKTLSAVFPKAQSSQSKAKQEAEMEASDTLKIGKKRKKNTTKWSEFLICGALYFNYVGTLITITATRTAHRLRYRNVQPIRRVRGASSRGRS